MKGLLFTSLLFLLALITSAQHSLRQQAEVAFHQYAYRDAAERYERLVAKGEDDYVVLRNLAFSYWMLRDFEHAEIYAGRAASMNTDPLDELLFAQTLKANRKYQLALESYARFAQKKPDDPRGVRAGESLGFYRSLLEQPSSVEMVNMSCNTASSEFGVTLDPDGHLIYSSSERKNAAVRRTYAWDRSAFLELYRMPAQGEYSWGSPEKAGAPFHSKFHDATVSFAPGGGQVAFTRNHHRGSRAATSKDGISRLNIYFSEAENGHWTTPEPFYHNNSEWNTGHPAFAPDGTTLYFVSDRPGGYGGTDLYRTRYVQGVWTHPVNLGPQINSPGDELFPWVDDSGTLYFASDGWAGLGGLDIFELRSDSLGWVPVNLGAPFNSSYDDFAFVSEPNGQYGFLSSNRKGGKGSDDIYRFILLPETEPLLAGTVVNTENGMPVAGATVLVNGPNGPCGSTVSSADGTFKLPITAPAGHLHVHVENGEGWTTFDASDIPWRPTQAIQNMGFTPISPLHWMARGTLVDSQTRAPLAGTTITLTDVAQGTPQIIQTGPQGVYQVHLSPGRQYEVRMERPGYFTRVEHISPTYGTQDLSAWVDPSLQPFEVGKAIELKNIHYDFDRHTIRPDAAVELDKLVKILNDNPELTVELASHTDARGNDAYNLALSERRAHAAVQYLIRRGIASHRLQSRGYGETRLRNRCTNGTDCPDAFHEENRRTEFTVLQDGLSLNEGR